jgi:cytochrome c biogenesis factor
MKLLTRLFLSLNTTFAVFFAFIIVAIIGSLSLVNNLAFFSGVDDVPLFSWLSTTHDLRKTWWIYVMIAVLIVLAINTIFCTFAGLFKKLGRRNLILKISPQIMHIGVLFVMLGHLLTASIGFKADMNINKGEKKTVTGNIAVSVDDVKVKTDQNGYYTDWEAKLAWFENGQKKHERILRPVHPLYFGEFGLYIRSVTMEPETSVFIRVCRDPGALWALLGGALLLLGGLGFIYGRFLE